MKKIFWRILIFLIISGLFIWFGVNYSLINKKNQEIKTQNINNKTHVYKYIVSGAFLQNGIHISNEKLTYKKLFLIANILPNSDLSLINDIFSYAPENTEIFIPFKDYKLKWSDFYDVKQITIANIQLKYAKILLKHRKENEQTTWNNILNISGIGAKTFEKLKTFLILNQ
ncbi:MAG0490 family ComEA-like DNA-binding protein [Mycoplasma leonicaptivi]|uniref:MAG0490 family ComEA-like DNA-binding protein n=1 Tax=Mycoplasma leonicaptivi TaxID=36742 RepID=UPI000482D5F9|nr:hypothetical protein [Mycoplasma leonicaptivi]